MSHTQILLGSQSPEDQTAEHAKLIKERLAGLKKEHDQRLKNVRWEKDLVAGNVWPPEVIRAAKASNIRLLTVPTASDIVGLGRALILPDTPIIDVIPFDQSTKARQEAEAVERWIYAAYDTRNLDAWSFFDKWGTETFFGMGAGHLIPDTLACDDEIPVTLDVPASESVLYHLGKRGLDYVFICEKKSVRDLTADYGYEPGSRKPSDVLEVWCYYAEERVKIGDQVERVIYYAVLFEDKLIVELTPVSPLFTRIPVFPVFSDGYHWQGNEAMRGKGMLTEHTSLLAYASDIFTQIANGIASGINPAIAVKQNAGVQPMEVDLGPGAINRMEVGEDIAAINATLPNPATYNFFTQVQNIVGNSTFPRTLFGAEDMKDVSGSTFSTAMNPSLIRNRKKQASLSAGIERFTQTFLEHMAQVLPPNKYHELYGVDPRNRQEMQAVANPAMLLKNCRIKVRLPNTMPRDAFLMVSNMIQLQKANLVSRDVAMNMIIETLRLPVASAGDMLDDIQADRDEDQRRLALQAIAQKYLPEVRQAANNEGLNPDLIGGEKPYRMDGAAIDPRLTAQQATAKVTELPMPQLPAPGGPPPMIA